MKHLITFSFILLFKSYSFSQADLLQKLHTESESNSQVMRSVSYLSDMYGPRLMGTSNYFNSVVWAERQLQEWKIQKTQKQSSIKIIGDGK